MGKTLGCVLEELTMLSTAYADEHMVEALRAVGCLNEFVRGHGTVANMRKKIHNDDPIVFAKPLTR